MAKTLYLVGQYIEQTNEHGIQGIFNTKQKAIEACRTENYWYMPLVLNENFPHQVEDIVIGNQIFYPLNPNA